MIFCEISDRGTEQIFVSYIKTNSVFGKSVRKRLHTQKKQMVRIL